MTRLIDIKANDPIDHYIMEHTFRPTSEQNELINYTRSLPGINSFYQTLLFTSLLIRIICVND